MRIFHIEPTRNWDISAMLIHTMICIACVLFLLKVLHRKPKQMHFFKILIPWKSKCIAFDLIMFRKWKKNSFTCFIWNGINREMLEKNCIFSWNSIDAINFFYESKKIRSISLFCGFPFSCCHLALMLQIDGKLTGGWDVEKKNHIHTVITRRSHITSVNLFSIDVSRSVSASSGNKRIILHHQTP